MSGHEATLLVIEDEPEIRRFLRASLPAHGYRLFEATTGRDGLAEAIIVLSAAVRALSAKLQALSSRVETVSHRVEELVESAKEVTGRAKGVATTLGGIASSSAHKLEIITTVLFAIGALSKMRKTLGDRKKRK